MDKKVGRNDPCPCGSGKKYKNCHMLLEQEKPAKYTASGKRKFKARVLSVQDQSLSIFSRSATMPQPESPQEVMERLRFHMTKSDFRKTEETPAGPAPSFEQAKETAPDKAPEPRERNLPRPGEEFKMTGSDFRKN